MKLKEKKDLLTGEVFTPKRISQNFSCAANRVKYYNEKANDLRHDLAYINKPLQKNFRILNEIMANKTEAAFHKMFLAGKGYDFGVQTHFEELNAKRYPAIYQFILCPVDGDTAQDKLKIKRK